MHITHKFLVAQMGLHIDATSWTMSKTKEIDVSNAAKSTEILVMHISVLQDTMCKYEVLLCAQFLVFSQN